MLKGSRRYTAASLWLLAFTLSFSCATPTARTILADVSSPSVEGRSVSATQISEDNLNIIVNLQRQPEADADDADATNGPPSRINFSSAIPLPLPNNPNPPSFYRNDNTVVPENSGAVSGADDGNTRINYPSFAENSTAPAVEINGQASTNNTKDVNSAAVGDFGYPFTTRGAYNSGGRAPTNLYPWRAAGKLFVQRGGTTFTCSASLVRRGLVVTAAHCVCEFGQGSGSIASSITYQPARYDNVVPYGSWTVRAVQVPASYLTGSDPCEPNAIGVVCLNDLAVLTVNADSNGAYPGDSTGWYGYGWGDYSFSNNFYPNAVVAQVTQLGYPGNIESGRRMIRTDALGIQRATNQVEIGSAQGPGSSGGPWLVNFGTRVSTSDPAGRDNNDNVVIATTSWGYTSDTAEVQGASRFGFNSVYRNTPNIVSLVNAACRALDSATRTRVCN